MAKLVGRIPGWDRKRGESLPSYFGRQREMLKKLCNDAALVDIDNTIVGTVISFRVSDGHAYYQVVKEKPLELVHIPFLESYTVHPALIRGLNKKDILKMETTARLATEALECSRIMKEFRQGIDFETGFIYREPTKKHEATDDLEPKIEQPQVETENNESCLTESDEEHKVIVTGENDYDGSNSQTELPQESQD